MDTKRSLSVSGPITFSWPSQNSREVKLKIGDNTGDEGQGTQGSAQPCWELWLKEGIRWHRWTLDRHSEHAQLLITRPWEPWSEIVSLRLGDLKVEQRLLRLRQRLEDVSLDVLGGSSHLNAHVERAGDVGEGFG